MEVRRVAALDAVEFQEVMSLREPVILCGLDLGKAQDLWSPDYLSHKVGSQPVKVHVCPEPQMDFIAKNFVYRTLPFQDFVCRSSCKRNTEYFLAPVMDNLLVQVVGSKRVVLFPPSDAPYLYLEGDKSQVTDINSPDLDKFPKFSRVQRYEAVLEPGEVLFLPALWFHHVTALEFGVAVNVFWRHLEEKFYDSKDPYGNKAPPHVQRAMQTLDKAVKLLEELPADHMEFYGGRLVAFLQRKLENRTGNT